MSVKRSECPECLSRPEGTKHCHGKCWKVKPLGDFHNAKDSADSKTNRCKECNNAKALEAGKQLRSTSEGRARQNAATKKYAVQHTEEKRLYDIARRATLDKDEMRAYQAQYRADHPEQYRTYGMARRARKSGASVCEDVERIIVADNYDWICQECFEYIYPEDPYLLEDGSRNPRYLHADHRIPLAHKGDHSYANMQPMHAICNIRKNARLDVRWEEDEYDADEDLILVEPMPLSPVVTAITHTPGVTIDDDPLARIVQILQSLKNTLKGEA